MGTRLKRADSSDAAIRILDVAQRLAQVRGFNGFSYADVAAQLGVTKASLHYHFASKADLGRALITRYTQRFCAALAQLDALQPEETLRKYVELFENVLVRDEMCLCGMFAAEWSTLPAQMQAELRRFFDSNEVWLSEALERGRSGGLKFEGGALETARTLTAGLEGAMLLSRSYAEPARFAQIADRLLSSVGVAHRPPAAQGTRLRRTVRASRRKVREAAN